MLYILYGKAGVHSGRALREEMSGLYKNGVFGGFPARLKLLARQRKMPTTIVNLGITEAVDCTARLLNSQDMVRKASNKRQARVTFHEAGVPSPKLTLRAADLTSADLPVVGRTSYHKKGEGFWFCKTSQDAQRAVRSGATHFLQFIPNTHEYRVHLFVRTKALNKDKREAKDYVSAKLVEKVWQGRGNPDPDQPQKNHEFGWVFLGPQNKRDEELDVVRMAAKQAIASLGLDFGAVDVMYSIRSKEPFVLEVNSTPSLSDDQASTCSVYAERLMRIISSQPEEQEA